MSVVPNSQERVVFLSIKPEYAEAILDGSKPYEYRRQPPVAGVPFTMLLYATDGVSEVVGAALVDDVKRADPKDLIPATVHDTPHDADEVRAYFDGTTSGAALHVRHAVRLEPPIERTEIRERWPDFTVPQNFRYVSEDSHAGLVELTRTRLNTNHG